MDEHLNDLVCQVKSGRIDHPPLCPGTEGLCLDGNGDLRGDYRRVWMARYQACAWMDRAKNGDFKGHDMALQEMQCNDNARAWREWERQCGDARLHNERTSVTEGRRIAITYHVRCLGEAKLPPPTGDGDMNPGAMEP